MFARLLFFVQNGFFVQSRVSPKDNLSPFLARACPELVEGKGARGMVVRLRRIQHPPKSGVAEQ
jgi:hypothetical protein